MSVETLNNSNEDLIQERLKELKDQIKPGIVKFENESRDKKYNIYSYTLVQGGTKGGIKNKYIKQIGPRIEGTQFTDVNGNEIKKDKFDAGERVFLRVPKKKETINQKERKNTPGKVEYIGNKKDKQNRNWKFYSYTFTQGGNIGGAMNKFESQLGKDTLYERYCDMNGNKLKKEWFNKGETIYYKEPNTDIIDPTPEITIEEVMKLSNEKIMDLGPSAGELTEISHEDKNGNYSILNGKKVYSMPLNPKECKNGRVYFFVEAHETASNVYSISIFKKEGNKFRGIYYDYLRGRVYRGNLKTNGYYEIIPEKQDY